MDALALAPLTTSRFRGLIVAGRQAATNDSTAAEAAGEAPEMGTTATAAQNEARVYAITATDLVKCADHTEYMQGVSAADAIEAWARSLGYEGLKVNGSRVKDEAFALVSPTFVIEAVAA